MTPHYLRWSLLVSLLLCVGCKDDFTGDAESSGEKTGQGDRDSIDGSDDGAGGNGGDTDDTDETETDTFEDSSDKDTSSSDAGEAIRLQAECAVSPLAGDCEGMAEGGTSESPAVWGQVASYPNLDPENDGAVGFFNGGTWIRLDDVDLTGMNTVTLNAGNTDIDGAQFQIRADAPDGVLIATVDVGITGDWNTFDTFSSPFNGAFSGAHDVYIVAVRPDVGNGNVDWIEFFADPQVEIDTDPVPGTGRIYAACAIDSEAAPCNGKWSGGTSESESVWGGPESYPAIDTSQDGTVVGYFSSDSWIRIDDVDLTGTDTLRASISAIAEHTGFYVRIDDAETGTQLAVISVDTPAGYGVFETVEVDLDDTVSGVHSVYFVAISVDENTGAGNIDWFEFL